MNADLEREFREFIEARSHTLFRTALALTGHRQQAEDLLQTVLVRGVRHWARIRTGAPEAYLRTALYREHTSWWRRIRRRPAEVSAERLPEPATADDTARVDLRLALRQALAQLPAKRRAVLVLRYLEDRPDSEIAKILGCSESTVRSQAARALTRLRELSPELNLQPKEEPNLQPKEVVKR
ncbi:SigE family RNA polymerase sigma factor [Plantactinospora sp. B6F1]|uniref:SigE family RNA polymerase sigma factor n=1 Tax=Plantactinospora sp. B6F1 TaxID=3158971 RepID=UPI00102BD821